MPRVSILRRDRAVQIPEPQRAEEVVAVTYQTSLVPPRILYLPLTAYRPATAEELAAQPRYTMVPASEASEELERKAIAQDLQQARAASPTSFDL